MPVKEREELFAVIGRRDFGEDLSRHDEGFEKIRKASLAIKEAAEYLKAARITLRRLIKAGKMKYNKIGRNFVFDPGDLKALKKG